MKLSGCFVCYSGCVWKIGTVLERREHELDAFEELGARERDDAEVEEDTEENGHGYDAEKSFGEKAHKNEHMNREVGQALLFHFAQFWLLARNQRSRVDRETCPMRQRTHRSRTHPKM